MCLPQKCSQKCGASADKKNLAKKGDQNKRITADPKHEIF